ncbi:MULTISPECIES: hypothetical protein [Shewanella]|uniref:hypothetical protein n=1 Tax=Shewanella TaxID=22 RepID=UPI000490F29F|nr:MULTISPECIES: hypothetical protein [Shewanella]QLE86249.1 hypothetical protein FLM48_14915 [Shewanella sp. Scap07]
MKQVIIISTLLGAAAFGALALTTNVADAQELNRDTWTQVEDGKREQAAIIAKLGYQQMRLVAMGDEAAVLFTNVNDQLYCNRQDALFEPIEASINVNLNMNNQSQTVSLPAKIGCEAGYSFALVETDQSQQLIAMMQDAKSLQFYDQSYSLKGFDEAVQSVID